MKYQPSETREKRPDSERCPDCGMFDGNHCRPCPKYKPERAPCGHFKGCECWKTY